MARNSHVERMAELQRRHNNGEKHLVLHALLECVCSTSEKPVPAWAKRSLEKAVHQVITAKAVSWDDVFGKPHAKRKIEQIRREIEIRGKVTKRVLALRRQSPPPRDIFQVVADEFQIGRSTVKRYFEKERQRWFSKPPTF
jgi:hypothetical protein